jgi:putative hydrolase
VIRRRTTEEPGPIGVMEVLQSPAQRLVFDRLLALSTLLEGHADHVMDAVGPTVVPSVATIRQRFTVRRRGGGLFDRVLRALLGVDAKMRQYAVGAAFTPPSGRRGRHERLQCDLDLSGDAAAALGAQ